MTKTKKKAINATLAMKTGLSTKFVLFGDMVIVEDGNAAVVLDRKVVGLVNSSLGLGSHEGW